MVELIGDIHNDADELVTRWDLLRYQKVQGVHRHPQRKVIWQGEQKLSNENFVWFQGART